MARQQRRYFLCTGQCVTLDKLKDYPHSHILGELRYVLDEGRRVTALAVWEVSAPAVGEDALKAVMLRPRVRVEIIGDARGIKCTRAGCLREERWEIGKAAFLILMQRYERKAVTA